MSKIQSKIIVQAAIDSSIIETILFCSPGGKTIFFLTPDVLLNVTRQKETWNKRIEDRQTEWNVSSSIDWTQGVNIKW